MTIDELMRKAPVIPVLVWNHQLDPAAVAETLVENGLPVIEVTLRTPGALDALRAMAKIPGAIAGAGTVLNGDMLKRSTDAGAQFAVSPGLTENIVRAASDAEMPLLPGAATATEIMTGLDLGLDRFKFFPAEASGGAPALKSIQGPFPNIRFCPTGGVTPDNARDYLSLDAVLCVGSSWILQKGETSLDSIAERARAAAALSH